jgi:hypothetical protein
VTPKPFEEDGKPKGDPVYSVEMLFDMDSLTKFKQWDDDKGTFIEVDVQRLAVTLLKERFGADFDAKAAHQHGGLHWPFRKGDTLAETKGAKGDHYKGKMVIRGKALSLIKDKPNAPRLYFVDSDGKRKELSRGLDSNIHRANDLFYSGAYFFAELSMVADETAQGKYVTFYVNSVRFVKDGERLGSSSLMDRFDGIQGGAAAVDPTKNLDDEIPF